MAKILGNVNNLALGHLEIAEPLVIKWRYHYNINNLSEMLHKLRSGHKRQIPELYLFEVIHWSRKIIYKGARAFEMFRH